MAANKFATKLHRSTHKIVVILVYAVLEWILITLLLFNSLFYYFIKKFASFFGLKPTCLWCSSVDCLFEPARKDGSFEGLFCEAHTSQISNKAVVIQNRCRECLKSVDNVSEDGFEDEVSCSCCGKSLKSDLPPLLLKEEEDQLCCNVSSEEPQILSDIGSFYLQEAAEEDSSRSTSNSLCNEESEDANEKNSRDDQLMESICVTIGGGSVVAVEEKDHKNVEFEKEVSCESDLKSKDLATRYEEEIFIDNETSANEALDDHPDEKHNEETIPILDHVKEENWSHFDVEQGNADSLTIERLRSELESERNAAAIAANQTMAMITRLQEEKAAIKMEAVQYQRMMEEQAEYDQEALQLLNELVIKREKEKQELEQELEVYKQKVLDYEVINDDSEKLSIDLNRDSEEIQIPSTGAVLETVDMVLDRVKNWNMLDGSLEEFEQERVSILHQLKELEEKLFSVCDDDPIEDLTIEKDHPTTMASAAKKLLPFLEKEENDEEKVALDVMNIEQKLETNEKVLAIIKEMDHVYGRLQALEADREFLRHCIGSLNKGDKGVGLLEEILQHLRELRNAESCEIICHD